MPVPATHKPSRKRGHRQRKGQRNWSRTRHKVTAPRKYQAARHVEQGPRRDAAIQGNENESNSSGEAVHTQQIWHNYNVGKTYYGKMTRPRPSVSQKHKILRKASAGQGSYAEKKVGERGQGRGAFYSTPWWSAALPPSPVKLPSLRAGSMATISARTSNTSLGTVLSYMEIRSLG